MQGFIFHLNTWPGCIFPLSVQSSLVSQYFTDVAFSLVASAMISRDDSSGYGSSGRLIELSFIATFTQRHFGK
jgi:hypothetical protein